MQWQPIETAPEKTVILLAGKCQDTGGWLCVTGEHQRAHDDPPSEDEPYGCHNFACQMAVWPGGADWIGEEWATHWMPLPEAPGACE